MASIPHSGVITRQVYLQSRYLTPWVDNHERSRSLGFKHTDRQNYMYTLGISCKDFQYFFSIETKCLSLSN